MTPSPSSFRLSPRAALALTLALCLRGVEAATPVDSPWGLLLLGVLLALGAGRALRRD